MNRLSRSLPLSALTLILMLILGCSEDTTSVATPDGDQEEEQQQEQEQEQEAENEPASPEPSDDPGDYLVDTGMNYTIQVSDPRWVVPSEGLAYSPKLDIANDNVDIVFFEDRLFMSWRTAPFHFASADTRMLIASSTDQGATWDVEHEIAIGTDVREPRFLAYKHHLRLFFFEAGTDPIAFEPQRMWRVDRDESGAWGAPQTVVDAPEIPWDLKVRNGKAYMTSYQGNHYEAGESAIEVYFKESTDGLTFAKVNGRPYVYKGGVSEAAFEFDAEGNLWAVTRNEDGDETGFGSHVCYASKDALDKWSCSPHSDPNRYDSPEMFRHGDEIYLVARRDVGGPYDQGRDDLSFEEQKSRYLIDYSLRPKGFALYRINRTQRVVEKMRDLPGCSDTAFPAVRRLDAHRFLLANYTSPLDMTDSSWITGQASKRGTQIYFLTLTFVPQD